MLALPRLAWHRVHAALARPVIEVRGWRQLSGFVDRLQMNLVSDWTSDDVVAIKRVVVLVEKAVGAHFSWCRLLLSRNSWNLDWVEPPSSFHHLFEDFLFAWLVVCLILLADHRVLSRVVSQREEVGFGVESAIRHGLVGLQYLPVRVLRLRIHRSVHGTLGVLVLGSLWHHRCSLSVG